MSVLARAKESGPSILREPASAGGTVGPVRRGQTPAAGGGGAPAHGGGRALFGAPPGGAVIISGCVWARERKL